MKKRILATLLVGAVAISSAVGFSACGDINVPKGEKVSQEVWENAFAKTLQSDNLTLHTRESADATVKGTIAVYDAWTETTTNTKIESSVKMTSEVLYVYNADANSSYDEFIESTSIKTNTDGEEQSLKGKVRHFSYYEPSEIVRNRQNYWDAEYKYEESESKSEGSFESSVSETGWSAEETTIFPPAYSSVSNELEDVFGDEYYESNDLKTEKKYLPELYGKFTYSNGYYKATLYLEVNIYESIYEVMECKVTVSIKDGYVTGYSVKANQKGNIEDKQNKMYYFDYDCKVDCVCAITDIGKTDVNKRLNKDITKALDKAKEEKENNN